MAQAPERSLAGTFLRQERPRRSVPRALWTLGYEGHSPESLVLTLRDAGIERLVDVRELPLSRKAGFSKTALAAGLAHAGIAYTHLRALGTPRAMRHAYQASGDADTFHRDYRAHLDAHTEALDELRRLAEKDRVAILCVERDVETCHRGVIAEAMQERGWTIAHL